MFFSSLSLSGMVERSSRTHSVMKTAFMFHEKGERRVSGLPEIGEAVIPHQDDRKYEREYECFMIKE